MRASRLLRCFAAMALLQANFAFCAAPGEKEDKRLQTDEKQREALGRLFFTRAQRAALDHRRHQPLPKVRNKEDAPVIVNGRVLRSSGEGTVWINGVPEDRRSEDDADARHVTIERPGRRVRVKVGETLDPTRGEVSDAAADVIRAH